MKLFTAEQISEIDAYTIKYEPIESLMLMERASHAVAVELMDLFDNKTEFCFFIGPGNNGGDGLAVARMMSLNGYSCVVYLWIISDRLSCDAEINLNRLKSETNVSSLELKLDFSFPAFDKDIIIVDALFGTGLSRVLDSATAELVGYINNCGNYIVSIDIPSGLFAMSNEGNNINNIIKARKTFTFQSPKISFLFAENESFVGDFKVLPIGLHPDAIASIESNYFFITKDFIFPKIKKRTKFSHKGTWGHAFLIAGKYGKMGAAVLCAKSCLRSGVGLISVSAKAECSDILQVAVPEVMVEIFNSYGSLFSQIDFTKYSALGIGPGISNDVCHKKILENIFNVANIPLVVDADALNIISENQDLLNIIPRNTIITPHPKEFDRLAGKSENGYLRHLKQIEFAKKYNIVVVLKGAHTSIAFPDGNCYFNSTGNPGMATAGSGDVLTGIILSLLAQGYSVSDAALAGVYIHGSAGNCALLQQSEESMIASDIIDCLAMAFKKLRN